MLTTTKFAFVPLYRSLSPTSIALLAGIAAGLFLMLRGIAHPWNGIDGRDGALFSSIAHHYLQFGVDRLHWGQLTTPEAIRQPSGAYYLHHPPLFPLLVAANFLAIGESETAARLVSVLATLLTAVVLFLIALRAYSRHEATLATFFFLTYPSTVVFGRKPGYEALTLFLVVLAAWLYLRYRDRPAISRRWLLLFVVALAAATDWPAFFLAPALALHAILYRATEKHDFALLTGLFLGPCLVLGAFLWSSYSVDRSSVMDLLHQGMVYMGLVSPDSAIAKHFVEARITFTAKEYVFRLVGNFNLNFGMLPLMLSIFGVAVLPEQKSLRAVVLILLAVALSDCLLFWRSLYFHLWWQHLLAAPIAILSTVAVSTLSTSLAKSSAESRVVYSGQTLIIALVFPVLVTLTYNVWQLDHVQTRILPASEQEPARVLPLLGAEIKARTATGDRILTNLAPAGSGNAPYDRVLPYYAGRSFTPNVTSPEEIIHYLDGLRPSGGNAYFLLWAPEVPGHNDALRPWLSSHALASEILVDGKRFGFFKLLRSDRTSGDRKASGARPAEF